MGGFGQEDALKRDFLQGVVEKFPQTDLVGVSTFGPTKNIVGIKASWDILENSRTTAPFRGFNSPAKSRKLRVRETKDSTVLLQALSVPIDESVMAWARQPGGAESFEAAVAGEQKNLVDEVDRTKEWMVWQALSTGALSVAQEDVKMSLSYGIPSNNQFSASATWATSTTDIVGDLNSWKIAIQKESGVTATDVWMNPTTMGYLLTNDYVKDFLGDLYKTQIAQSGRVMKLLEMNLHVVNGNYDTDGAGTIGHVLADNKVVVTCGTGFTEFQVGTQAVPNDSGVGVTIQKGRYSYAYTQKDPVVNVVVVGENYLFVIKEVERVGFCADVTP